MPNFELWMWIVVFLILCLTTLLIPKIVKNFYELKYGVKYSQYFASMYAAQSLYVATNLTKDKKGEVNGD